LYVADTSEGSLAFIPQLLEQRSPVNILDATFKK